MKISTNIAEWIFGKTEKVQHPFWGEMIDAGDYYECERNFNSINNIVEIGLEKMAPGTDQNQIDFFNSLDENYEKLIMQISPSLLDEIQRIIPKYKIDDFSKNFRLVYLYIPKCDIKPYQWEIGFDEVGELHHHCLLKMDEYQVIDIHIDG